MRRTKTTGMTDCDAMPLVVSVRRTAAMSTPPCAFQAGATGASRDVVVKLRPDRVSLLVIFRTMPAKRRAVQRVPMAADSADANALVSASLSDWFSRWSQPASAWWCRCKAGSAPHTSHPIHDGGQSIPMHHAAVLPATPLTPRAAHTPSAASHSHAANALRLMGRLRRSPALSQV
jgi:hypothetical protein